MVDATTIEIGDFLKFKKNHPCGSNTWKVLRIGIDFKLECTTCGRVIMIPRLEVIKKAKEVIQHSQSVIKENKKDTEKRCILLFSFVYD